MLLIAKLALFKIKVKFSYEGQFAIFSYETQYAQFQYSKNEC